MQVPTADLEHVISYASSDLHALKGAKLFITGGTGYIGLWLLESLCYANKVLDLGISATVLSRNPKAFQSSSPHLANDRAITLLAGDVRNFPFPRVKFTHAIHAATDVIATNEPIHTFDVTTLGTRHVLEFCQQCEVNNVLLLSSGAIYGKIPHNIDLVTEAYRGCPDLDSTYSAYGIGKIVTEWLGTVYSNSQKFSCTSARVFAQVGPYLALDRQFAVGNFIQNALKAESFIIKGDGTPRRSYMYAADLVTWLWGILVRGQRCRAYNVGSDHSISIVDLATKVAQTAGITHPEICILSKPSQYQAPERYVPDISRAREELGLEIRISLDDALKRTLEWYRQQI
ncbi:MAG: NAD(P)-dependent oxidoreductase [Pseudomonadota bacterium]